MFNVSDSYLLSDSRAVLWQQLRRKDNESGSLNYGQSLSSEFTEFGKAVGWLLLVLLVFTIILSIHRCPPWLNSTDKPGNNEKDGYQTTARERSIAEESTIDQLDNSYSQLNKPIKDASYISSLHQNPLSDRKWSQSNSFFSHMPELDVNIEFDVVLPVITPFVRRRIDLHKDFKSSKMWNIGSRESNCRLEEKGSVRNSAEVIVEPINGLKHELSLTLAATDISPLCRVSVNSYSNTRLEMTETMSDGNSLSVLEIH